jgi:ankyrin repeat protein
MASICKNDFRTFHKFMDKRKNPIPIEINYRSESNWCPIHYAAMHAGANIMSCLINHPQIDVNALTDFNWTPLHIAVQSNRYDNC